MARIAMLTGVAVVVMVGIVVVFSTQSRTPAYVSGGELDVRSAIDYWKEEIPRLGPERAYTQMIREALALPANKRHIFAHTYGDALYSSGILENVVHCGKGEFMYGCFHQFMGLATAEYGTRILEDMKKICDKTKGDEISCAHSIGHAFVSAEGYEFESLDNALAKCERMYASADAAGICADGAFMEYNLTEMETLEKNAERRPMLAGGEYQPCTDLPATFRDECVYLLPLWWHFSLPKYESDHETYERMAELCRSIPLREQRDICFVGIGFPLAQSSEFDDERIARVCGQISETKSENLICLAGAARRLVENSVDEKPCAPFDLGDEDMQFCETYVSIGREKGYELVRSSLSSHRRFELLP